MTEIQSFLIMIKLSLIFFFRQLLMHGNRRTLCILVAFSLCILSSVGNTQLEETITRIKPAIVGIGTYQKMNSPPITFRGTGFVVGDGLHVVTNAHVIPEALDLEKMEKHVVITGQDNKPELRDAAIVSLDRAHDIALLKISGAAMPVMRFGESETVREGKKMAYTGFPIGMVLGFYPVTHQAIISSITPIIRPAHNTAQLDAKLIRQLQSPFLVFQLDGVAYPGNSGSPLYDPDTGLVYGIINMVYVKGSKEAALSAPSGISYAIPGKYIADLLKRSNVPVQ
ncbi:Trypsin-like peptidase domain-containing protein [Nitrosomonas sp. Nm51]|uniref:S1 family peptidase n=1 Tax=Nitrosomonas sp. Nm51 TaxID=133720 RepID=UPI0008CCEBED|nr:serine protease [Nitrosomonas sp. Nm51]SER05797.1 Trypsin-like peptidase domain-containing protein [Nitrosomonas sp. Nm51]